MKTIIEIHALQNFAPSNLNRDDTGAPKDAFFGGTRRARISSQCLKNAVRKYFEIRKKDKLFKDGELAIRTKRVLSKLVSILVENKRNEVEAREKVINAINALGFSFKDNDKTEYLLFLGETEIVKLATLIHEKWDEIGNPGARLAAIKKLIQEKIYVENPDSGKLNAIFRALEIDGESDKVSDEKITAVENNFDEIIKVIATVLEQIEPLVLDTTNSGSTKSKKRKKSELSDWEKAVNESLKDGAKGLSPMGKILQKVMDGGKAVDLALFGRMLADMPEKNQNAACQVAHAISTHTVNREFDFYTAIDQLKPDDNAGSDMMGTIEFNSACFYRYAIVDWDTLVKNLQSDTELAAKGLRAFLEGFVVAEPTGMQNSFAAHNPPEFVAVSVRRGGAPRNLANAFEIPIKPTALESLTLKSAEKLIDKANALSKFFGQDGKTRIALTEDTFEKFDLKGAGEKCDSSQAAIEWALEQVTQKE